MTEQSSKPEFDSSAEKPLTKRGNVLLDPTDEHDAKLFINDLAHSFFDTK